MAITKDFERQYPLSALVEFTYLTLTSGSAEEAIDIPQNAIVTGGEIVVDTVFDSGTSDVADVGDGNDANRYASAVDLTAAARTALTLTTFKYTEPDTIDITLTSAGAAATQGAGRLRVEYVKTDRGNENYR